MGTGVTMAAQGGGGRRFLDWALARRLDEALARGDRPDSSVLLAFHAQVLQSLPMRHKLARDLSSIVHASRGTRTSREERSGIPWAVVSAAFDDLDDLALRLRAPEATAPRGVALTRLLLTDRSGPLRSGSDPAALSAAAGVALAALTPLVRLDAPAPIAPPARPR